jgi:hypothetical protein
MIFMVIDARAVCRGNYTTEVVGATCDAALVWGRTVGVVEPRAVVAAGV